MHTPTALIVVLAPSVYVEEESPFEFKKMGIFCKALECLT